MSRYQHISVSAPGQKIPKKVPIGRYLLLLLALVGLWKCWQPNEKVSEENQKPKVVENSSSSQETKALSSIASSSSEIIDEEAQLRLWAKNQPDSNLALKIGTYLNRYHPVGAVYLMVDGKSNQILAYGQYSDSILQPSAPWLRRGDFPAASLAKTITATAALESGKYANHSRIPVKGGYHTLYKKQLDIPKNYQGETMSLEMAYSKSANPPFGIIGQDLGGEFLSKIAYKMGFNRNLPNLDTSSFITPDSGYGLAEMACGFNTNTTLTPLLAAAQVRSILAGEPLELPFIPGDTSALFKKRPPIENSKLKNNTYFGLRKMMQSTSQTGTSSRLLRKHMYRYVRKKLISGSKTGTLDGENPKGRYDWFVGYAYEKDKPDNSVVIVVLQIYDDFRTLRSSAIAGLLLNDWEKYILSTKDSD